MGDHSINFANVLNRDAERFSEPKGLSINRLGENSTDVELNRKGNWTGYLSVVQETERRRIASELHDGLGQMLTVLAMELRSAKTQAIACSPIVPGVCAALERAYGSARQAIDELHRSVMNLYPSMLDDLGVVASISAILREARAADPRLHIEADITITEAQVPPALRIVAFRIVQEAVNNVLKHAKAEFLHVKFSYCNGELSLNIADNGQGISPCRLKGYEHGSGINGMIRRVRDSGGDIDMSSCCGKGTKISVVWNTSRFHQ